MLSLSLIFLYKEENYLMKTKKRWDVISAVVAVALGAVADLVLIIVLGVVPVVAMVIVKEDVVARVH